LKTAVAILFICELDFFVLTAEGAEGAEREEVGIERLAFLLFFSSAFCC